jgi:hypothetical protein
MFAGRGEFRRKPNQNQSKTNQITKTEPGFSSPSNTAKTTCSTYFRATE